MIFNPITTTNGAQGDPSNENKLLLFTNPEALTSFLAVEPNPRYTLYAPATFRSVVLAPKSVCFVPYLASIDVLVSEKKQYEIEAHAVNKTLLRCVWIVRRKNSSKAVYVSSIMPPRSPAAKPFLTLKEDIYVVGYEGQPDKLYLDIIVEKLAGNKFTLVDNPSGADANNILMKRSALIQFQETLDEAVKATLLRKGKLIIASDYPLYSYLRLSDLYNMIISRVPANLQCPFSLYGGAVTKYLLELDTNSYNSVFTGPETATFNFENPKFKSKFYGLILDKALEVVLSPQVIAKRIDQAETSLCLYSLLPMKSLLETVRGLQTGDSGENPLLKTKLNVFSANQDLNNWKWDEVLKAFLDVDNETKLIIYLINEETTEIDENLVELLKTRYNIQFIALPLYSFDKNPWTWCEAAVDVMKPKLGGHMLEIETSKTYDVSTEGHTLVPLTGGMDEPLFMLVRNELMLTEPICQLTLNSEDQTEYMDGHLLTS